jgi:hypothetical protein
MAGEVSCYFPCDLTYISLCYDLADVDTYLQQRLICLDEVDTFQRRLIRVLYLFDVDD